ncbi:MAG: EAL domain-containing protein [Campylobacterota bacterium]|nr:EAL domain-containing protein [Campylobacterota bacterium]
MLKEKSISIYQLIYRHFKRQFILTFLLIFILIAALFLLNNHQFTSNKTSLEALAKNSFEEISKQTSKLINQRFNLDKLRLYQLRDTLELILNQEDSFSINDGKWIDRGGFYFHYDDDFREKGKTSVYSTNLLNITPKDIAFLSALKVLTPSVAQSVDNPDDLITSAWINIGKKYALAYPAIAPIDELSPELDVTEYSFYYSVNPIHNPSRDIVHLPLYQESWAVDAGELGAFLIPIYHHDTFIGVIGLTLSAKGLADIISDLKLPFDAYVQLLDEKGFLIATSDDTKSYNDFAQHSFYKLHQNPDIKNRSLVKIEHNALVTETSTYYQRKIIGTNLHLNIIAKDEKIFSTSNTLNNQALIVGISLAITIILIYIYTLIISTRAIKTLASQLSNTLSNIINFSSHLGQGKDITLAHSGISEFDTLNANLTKTHEKLLELIIKDERTGLHNRHILLQDLEDETDKSLMLIEIKNYKTLFNLYGIKAANILLEGIVAKLNQCKKMKVYRLEDDTFALLLKNKDTRAFLKLIDEIAALDLFYESIAIEPHIFSAIAQSHPLLEQASIALLEAKERHSFVPVTCKETREIKEKFKHNLRCSNRFNRALREQALIPYFQAIYNVKTGCIDTFESLVRIKEADKIIAPLHFLEAATQMDKIHEITKIMIQKVFAIAARHRDISFNINVSFKDFLSIDLLLYIQDTAFTYNIIPSQITFELLEADAIEEFDPILSALATLKKEGYKIAIDDFATQHSNFAHLMMMQVDYIKIDGQCSATIAKTITKFSQLMGAKSVAKFVADETILKRVELFGIDYAQGYEISPPLPGNEIDSFLEDFNNEKA